MARLVAVAVAITGCGNGSAPDVPSHGGSGSAVSAIALDGAPIGNADVTLGSDRFRVPFAVDLAFEGTTPIVVATERLSALDVKTGHLSTIVTLDFDVAAIATFPHGVAVAGSDQARRGRLWIRSQATPARDISIATGVPTCVDAASGGDHVIVAGPRGLIEVELASMTPRVLADGDWACAHYVDDTHWVGLRRKTQRSLADAMTETNSELFLGSTAGLHSLGGADRVAVARGIVFSAERRGAVRSIHGLTGAPISTFTVPAGVATMRTDGDSVLVGDSAGTIAAYSATGVVEWSAHAIDHPVELLAIAGDGSVMFAGEDRVIGILGVDHRPTADPGAGHRGRVTHLAWSNERLVSSAIDGTIRVWDTGTAREITRWTPAGRSIEGLAANRNGQVAALVATSSGPALDIRDLAGRLTRTVSLRNGSAIGTDRSGNWIVADGMDTMKIEPDREPELIARSPWMLMGHVEVLPDGVAGVGTNWAFHVRGLGVALKNVDTRIPASCRSVYYAAGDVAGTLVAVLNTEREMRLWKRDGTFVRGVVLPPQPYITGEGAITPDGTVVFPASDGLILWKATGLVHARLGPINAIAVGSSVAAGFADGRIAVWRSLDRIVTEAEPSAVVPALRDDNCRGEYDDTMVNALTGSPLH